MLSLGRSSGRVLRSVFHAQHYVSLARSWIYMDWRDYFLRRYVLGQGTYPYACRIRTPLGPISLTLNCPWDCYTVQEIFGLECYRARQEEVIVDFGANIGVSAAYFLSRNPRARVYGFEPVKDTFAKLKANLAPFGDRCELRNVAVMHDSGVVSFCVEPTGRCCGFDCADGEPQQFPCVSATEILTAILEKHARIDILKIDVEGAEQHFVPALPPALLGRIGKVYIEGQRQFSIPGFDVRKSISGVDCYTPV